MRHFSPGRLRQYVRVLVARRRGDAVVRSALNSLAAGQSCPRLAEAIERERRKTSEHFGLAYLAGFLFECLASEQPWDSRTGLIERAVQHYTDALQLAERKVVDGAALLADLHDSRWANGLSLAERAETAASYQLGRLYTVEYRVRNPSLGAALLRCAAERTSGYHPARYYLGEAYLLDGRLDEAEKVWQDALALNPVEQTLLAVLAKLPIDRVHLAVRSKNWCRVLEELARLPEDATMPESERRTIEGDAYAALHQPERARASWEAALRADHLAVGVRRRLLELGQSASSDVL